MQVWNLLYAARWKHRTQKSHQKSPSGHHHTTLSGYIFETKACIDNRKKNLLSSSMSSTPHNMVNFGPLAAEIDPVVWGTPENFNGFHVLAALLQRHLVVGVSQMAHILVWLLLCQILFNFYLEKLTDHKHQVQTDFSTCILSEFLIISNTLFFNKDIQLFAVLQHFSRVLFKYIPHHVYLPLTFRAYNWSCYLQLWHFAKVEIFQCYSAVQTKPA